MVEKTFAEKLSAKIDTQIEFKPVKDELFKLDLCSLTLAGINPFHPKEEQLAQQLAKFILEDTGWKANSLINNEISYLPDYHERQNVSVQLLNFIDFGSPIYRTLNRAKNILDVQHCRDKTSPTAEVTMGYIEEWHKTAGYSDSIPRMEKFEVNFTITPDSPGDARARITYSGRPEKDYKTKNDLINLGETDIYK